jgi:hypothetical protein
VMHQAVTQPQPGPTAQQQTKGSTAIKGQGTRREDGCPWYRLAMSDSVLAGGPQAPAINP